MTAPAEHAELDVAVVGLGPLGLALARHVHGVVGSSVLGIDIDQGRRRAWDILASGRSSDAIEDAMRARHVFVAVSDDAASFVIARQLASAANPPTVYVLTTMSPETASAFDDGRRPGRDCWPVQITGGETGALRGQLIAIVPEDFPDEAERFLCRTVAVRVVRVKDARSAALIKLLGNALIAFEYAGVAAILDAGAEIGLDLAVLLDLLQSGSSGSSALRALHDYSADGLEKDLRLLGDVTLKAADPFDAPAELVRMRRVLRQKPVQSHRRLRSRHP